jgi:hypothetical protein
MNPMEEGKKKKLSNATKQRYTNLSRKKQILIKKIQLKKYTS